MDEKIKRDTEFLTDILIDEGMINGDIGECKTEVGKRALEIYYQFEDNPKKITFGHIQDLVVSESTQIIGNPGNYLAHVQNTGGIFRGLVKTLEKLHPNLDLPVPDVAYATGLIHDLNATFSDYKKTGQQSKEFDQFLLAKRLGWKTIETQVAMHSDYLGGIRLMYEGVDFPKQEAYVEMKKILQGHGPPSYENIEKQFKGYLEGREKLHLLLLTVSDYMESSKPHFGADTFIEDYEKRARDVVWRYHGKAISENKTPSLLGQALVDGGIQRIAMYRDIIFSLIENNVSEIKNLKETTKFFRK